MPKRVLRLINRDVRARAIDAVKTAPDGWSVTIAEPTRTAEQNAALWPILHAFANQRKWLVNGELVYMTEDDWKDLTSASFRKEQNRVAQGMEGGFVMLGQRTSHFPKSDFSAYLDYLHAAAIELGVNVYPQEQAA